MKKTIFQTLFLFFALVQLVQSQCVSPENFAASNITATSGVISWTDPNNVLTILLVLL